MMNKKGFTTPELMVVLAIVGILSASGSVSYIQNISKMKLNQAGNQIVSSLYLIRNKAINQGVNYGLGFEEKNGRIYYYLFQDKGEIVGQLDKSDLIEDMEVLSERILMNLPPTFQDKTAIFTAYGTSNGGTVSIKNQNGEVLSIIVLSNTGRIKVDYEKNS